MDVQKRTAKIEDESKVLSNPGKGLGMMLLRAREAVMSEYRPIFRQQNLTEQQWRVLRFLEINTSLDSTSLSEKSMILLPSLTRIVRDLEARGLVCRAEKAPGPSRVLLSITEAGRELVRSTAPQIAERQTNIQAKLTKAEQRQLVSLLEKLARD